MESIPLDPRHLKFEEVVELIEKVEDKAKEHESQLMILTGIHKDLMDLLTVPESVIL